MVSGWRNGVTAERRSGGAEERESTHRIKPPYDEEGSLILPQHGLALLPHDRRIRLVSLRVEVDRPESGSARARVIRLPLYRTMLGWEDERDVPCVSERVFGLLTV